MAQSIKLVVFPVKDIEKAKAFYSTFLGAEPYAESPYYVGYRVGDQEIGLDPNSTVGPISYIDVQDIKKVLRTWPRLELKLCRTLKTSVVAY